VLAGDGSRGTVVIWVVAAVLGGFALLHLAGSGGSGGSGGSQVRIQGSPGRAGGAGPASGADREHAAAIYVHVAGAVRRPGLLRLAEGARVAVALERAGGPQRRADLAGVNLAARLEDGQQVIVPVRGAAAAVPGAAGSATAGAGSGADVPGAAGPGTAGPGAAGVPKLSLAAVTVEQLDEIDGIGPTLAQRIVEYRTENGGFRSLAELREVEGIGEKRFETLSEALQP
jgi:competence protein ComEA